MLQAQPVVALCKTLEGRGRSVNTVVTDVGLAFQTSSRTKTRSSSREVRKWGYQLLSVGEFSRGTLPQKRVKRALLRDI